jgi:hypothetical protein
MGFNGMLPDHNAENLMQMQMQPMQLQQMAYHALLQQAQLGQGPQVNQQFAQPAGPQFGPQMNSQPVQSNTYGFNS